MSIYRVTFQTCLLVECDDEVEAEEIGRDFLAEEVGNADLFGIECLSSKDQLEKIEQGSLPWRSWERRISWDDGEDRVRMVREGNLWKFEPLTWELA